MRMIVSTAFAALMSVAGIASADGFDHAFSNNECFVWSGEISTEIPGAGMQISLAEPLCPALAELAADADGDPTNELQTITLEANATNGTDLRVDGVLIGTIADNDTISADNLDNDPTNEIQVGDGLTITGTGTAADPFAAVGDGTGTDDQALSLINDVLQIENGNSVDLSVFRSPPVVPNLDNIADGFASPLGTISNTGTADDLELDAGLLRVRETADGCFYEYYDVRDPSTVIQTVRNRDDAQSFSATLPLDSLSYTAADLNAIPANVLTDIETQTLTWTNPSACRAASVHVTVRGGNWQANRMDAGSNINVRTAALGLSPGIQFDSTGVVSGVVTYQTGTLIEPNRYRVAPGATLTLPVVVSMRVFAGFPAASTATLFSLNRRATLLAVLE